MAHIDASSTGSPDPRFANLLGALSTGLADAIQESTATAAGLDGSAPAALVALLDFLPGGTVRALSQVVGLTHSGAVRLVDRLVSDGLVVRSRGRDSRSRSITLTPAGKKVALRVRIAREGVISGAIEHFTDGERAALTALCERLIAGVTLQRLEERAAGRTPAGGALCRMCDFAACGRDAGLCPAAQAREATPSTIRAPAGSLAVRSRAGDVRP